MSRKFIASVVAGAVALSIIGANPSFAGSRDRDKALLGLTAFVLLGAAIADASKDRKRNDHSYGHGHTNHNSHGHGYYETVKPRPLPPQVRKKILPRECLRVVNTRGQNTRLLGTHCLQNTYRWTAQLPRNCSVKVWTRQGQLRGYAPQCLRQYGYRLNG